jgi:hypothetical protein
MKILARHPFGLLLCASWLVAPSFTYACVCTQVVPGACHGLQNSDVVFLGTVTDIDEIVASPALAGIVAQARNVTKSPEILRAGVREPNAAAASFASGASATRYHFRIDEKFAGPDTQEMDVFSGGEDGDCGYAFEKGKQYIVFTDRKPGSRLFATICNGTRPASDGRALLPQLRAMRDGERVASVFGILRRADPPFLAPSDIPEVPLPNIALRLRSRDDRFSTSSGDGGVYSFYDVHAGEYRFSANPPVQMLLTQRTLTGGLAPVTIPDGACYEYDVDALPSGHIRGSVLGPDGKPLPLASVELYRAGPYAETHPGLWSLWSSQGAVGYFDFDHIGPGEYVIVYNRMNRIDPDSPFPRSFYSGGSPEGNGGDVETIRLKDGQQLLQANIRLHDRYPTRKLRVRVNWEHDRLPGTLTVMAKADDGTVNPAAQKIGEGVFEFTLLQSRHYTVSAWEDFGSERSVDGGNAPACRVPARIDAGSVTVDASNPDAKEVMLTFSAVECAKE